MVCSSFVVFPACINHALRACRKVCRKWCHRHNADSWKIGRHIRMLPTCRDDISDMSATDKNVCHLRGVADRHICRHCQPSRGYVLYYYVINLYTYTYCNHVDASQFHYHKPQRVKRVCSRWGCGRLLDTLLLSPCPPRWWGGPPTLLVVVVSDMMGPTQVDGNSPLRGAGLWKSPYYSLKSVDTTHNNLHLYL
jgi:hypothetical protein